MSISLPMTKYAYKDDDLVYDVVDVMKLYPEILNNTSWRDATYQLVSACNQFHPYVFGKIQFLESLGISIGICIDMGMDTDISIDSNINYLDFINDWVRAPFGACIC